MKKGYKLTVPILLALGVVLAAALYMRHVTIPVLDPQGPVGQKERQLIIFALFLSTIVVIPVFILLGSFAWRYRAGNKKAKYSPELDHNRLAETIWWVIPSILILILSVLTWNSSHQLDPYKPLASNNKPLTIQVVALDWKWLFIYPQQQIATVNFVQLPEKTPVDFVLTSDTVMNSFWIPQLGGQMYAMPGMTTHLHLEANKAGSYDGSSANISGEGFAGMKFEAHSTSRADFDRWVQSVRQAPDHLNTQTYAALAKPSKDNPAMFYAAPDPTLYDTIVMKYMMPMAPDTEGMTNMGHGAH